MGKVLKFQAHGKEYPLAIIERDDGQWVLAQQVGEAIGTQQIRRLIFELKQSGELRDGIHCRTVSEHRESDGKLSQRVMLSYRGVMRVMMRSQGSRSREFRDWAEDVLLQVMTTGSYFSEGIDLAKISHNNKYAIFNRDAIGLFHNAFYHRDKDALEKITEAMCKLGELEYIKELKYQADETYKDSYMNGIQKGLKLYGILAETDKETLAKVVHFRRLGLSRNEIGRILGKSKDQVKWIEDRLQEFGVSFAPVQAQKRDKQIRESLIDNLLSSQPSSFIPQISVAKGGEC